MNMNESLHQHRVSRHLTRQEIADLLEISVRTYQTYETGTREPRIEALIKIADFYNISMDDLIGRTFPKDSLMNTEQIF